MLGAENWVNCSIYPITLLVMLFTLYLAFFHNQDYYILLAKLSYSIIIINSFVDSPCVDQDRIVGASSSSSTFNGTLYRSLERKPVEASRLSRPSQVHHESQMFMQCKCASPVISILCLLLFHSFTHINLKYHHEESTILYGQKFKFILPTLPNLFYTVFHKIGTLCVYSITFSTQSFLMNITTL
jgi:hypothetical protein